ncbi:lipopolysaccharide assembly protein LapA domain-containing protein [uncultured Parasphingopyxis sp.]|uniref:lipopolysaccharide assembly protein LapA domain-containing protein n=1 Tax=uncultured Parasphingopyxis sp. TaxID=1547918 RepID=UPI002627F79F|nr:lipopolysaccharide assembly protein LapA domain-containing protein [uncultured Parasphingopyxis sp.]
MNFLKTLFWIVLSAVVVIFSLNNWLPVTLNLWGGLQADVKLPVLLLFVFLVGFVPAMIYYRTRTWRLTRRLETVERELADARGLKQFRTPEPATKAKREKSAELTLDQPAPPEPQT